MKITYNLILVVAVMILFGLGVVRGYAETPEATPDIIYQIMVQRATQSAIWGMPAAATIDFEKAIKRYLGGEVNDVVYVSKPGLSKNLKAI